jgi:voltage-gated potassium channel
MPETRLERLVRALEWPLAVLALLVIPVLVMEERATTPEIRQLAVVVNWVIWIAFAGDFAVRWAADGTRSYPRRAWFDLLLIVLTPPVGVPEVMQGVRSLRLLRLLRLVRAFAVAGMGVRLAQRHFGRQKFHYALIVTTAVVVLGAVGFYALESDENQALHHFGDALWWAITTVTTVGYGDITPITPEGRLIAVVLMLTGIGVIGLFTASVASLFFEEQKGPPAEMLEIRERLERIEQQLELLRRP